MKRLLPLCCILLCAITFAAPPRTVSVIDADIRRQEGEIKKTGRLLEDYRRQTKTSQRQVALYHSLINDRVKMITLLDEQVGALEEQLKNNQDSLKKLSAQREYITQQYAAEIRTAYKNRLINSNLTLLFASNDFNGYVRRNNLLKRINRYRHQLAEKIDTITQSVNQKNEQLAAQRAELLKKQTLRTTEYAQLQRDEAESNRLLKQLDTQINSAQSSVRNQQNRLQELQREREAAIRSAAQASRRTTTVSSQTTPQRTAVITGRFEQNRGVLPPPVIGKIIQKYGIQPRSNGAQVVHGLVFACQKGATVSAVFDGTVGDVRVLSDGLTCITISHGNYTTSYSGLSSVNVKPLDIVKTKQAIGTTSVSERADDWKMTFYLFDSDFETIDPAVWLSL